MLNIEDGADAYVTLATSIGRDVCGADLPIGPKYPMNSASFQFLTQRGISRYVMKMAGMRRKTRIRKPRMNSLPSVIPVTSGI